MKISNIVVFGSICNLQFHEWRLQCMCVGIYPVRLTITSVHVCAMAEHKASCTGHVTQT